MKVLYPDGFINTDSTECVRCGKQSEPPYLLLCKERGDDAEDSEIYRDHKRKMESQSDNEKH